MQVLLPLSALHKYRACELDTRIEAFTACHGHPPDESSTFREWMEVTPCVQDLIWACRCDRELVTHIAAPLARRAAARAAAYAAADAYAARAAAYAARAAADAYAARAAAAAYAAGAAADAAYAAADAGAAAYAAGAAAAGAAADAAAAYATERRAQRRDFEELLLALETQ